MGAQGNHERQFEPFREGIRGVRMAEGVKKVKQEGKGRHTIRRTAAAWLVALLLLIWLICLAIALTVWCRPLYYWDIEHLHIPEQAGLSLETVRENYDALIDYNLLISPDTLTFPDFPMSTSGRTHFAEVKRIFVAAQWIALIGAGIFLLACLRVRSDIWYRALGYAGWLAGGAVLLVGGTVLVSWDTAFTLMHKLLFRNDYWIFDAATDPVITILPDTFFLHCGVMILLLVALGILGFRLLRRRLFRDRIRTAA